MTKTCASGSSTSSTSGFSFYFSDRSAVTHTEPTLLLLQATSSMNKELHFSVSEDVNLVLGLVFVFRNVKPFILVIKDFI